MSALRNLLSAKTNEKSDVWHVESSQSITKGGRLGGNDPEIAAVALPAGFEHVDAETAKYLDPTLVIDEETNRTIKRMVSCPYERGANVDSDGTKLDRRILPFLVVSYFFQTCESHRLLGIASERDVVDKGTLASSSVMGIQADNHLVGQQYSLLGTILYIGIIIGEVRAPGSKVTSLTHRVVPCEPPDPAGPGGQVPRNHHHLLGGSYSL